MGWLGVLGRGGVVFRVWGRDLFLGFRAVGTFGEVGYCLMFIVQGSLFRGYCL